MALIQASLSELQAQSPTHGHLCCATNAYFAGGLEVDRLDALLHRISSTDDLLSDQRACVLFGRGSRPRRVYSDLQADLRVQVVWEGPFVPWLLRPLSWLAAAHGGLVKVLDRSAVADTFRNLADLALVELYSFEAESLESVVNTVLRDRWRAQIGPVVGSTPAYFCLGVDGDSRDTAEGLFAWSSFGAECPVSLRSAIDSVVATAGAPGLSADSEAD